MLKGIGSPDRVLVEKEVHTLLEEGTPASLFERKRVLVLTPDTTRTCPLPMMIRSVGDVIGARTVKLDFMVALGTHTPLAHRDILKLYGIDDSRKRFDGSQFFNHEWGRQDSFARISAGSQFPNRFLVLLQNILGIVSLEFHDIHSAMGFNRKREDDGGIIAIQIDIHDRNTGRAAKYIDCPPF